MEMIFLYKEGDNVVLPSSFLREIVLASRPDRLAAAIIDSVLEIFVGALFLYPFIRIAGIDGFEELFEWTDANAILSSVVFLVLGAVVYSVLHYYFLNKNGQTIGKRIIGIKIVGVDGYPLNFSHIFLLRFLPIAILAQLPGGYGLAVCIVNVACIFHASRRCLHDYIAGSIVIKA